MGWWYIKLTCMVRWMINRHPFKTKAKFTGVLLSATATENHLILCNDCDYGQVSDHHHVKGLVSCGIVVFGSQWLRIFIAYDLWHYDLFTFLQSFASMGYAIEDCISIFFYFLFFLITCPALGAGYAVSHRIANDFQTVIFVLIYILYLFLCVFCCCVYLFVLTAG